jgi:hypothetical protein
MNIRLIVVIVMLCSLSPAAFGRAPNPSKPLSEHEKTLMAAEQSFVDAAKKGDAAFFQRTLTDDFSFVGFDGQLADRQEMIDQHSEAGFNLLPYNMKVMAITDGVALVTYDVVLRVPQEEDQGPPPRYQHFSTVWVKQGDAWKMKFQQRTASHWGDW